MRRKSVRCLQRVHFVEAQAQLKTPSGLTEPCLDANRKPNQECLGGGQGIPRSGLVARTISAR